MDSTLTESYQQIIDILQLKVKKLEEKGQE
jgi:hypothetical protein